MSEREQDLGKNGFMGDFQMRMEGYYDRNYGEDSNDRLTQPIKIVSSVRTLLKKNFPGVGVGDEEQVVREVFEDLGGVKYLAARVRTVQIKHNVETNRIKIRGVGEMVVEVVKSVLQEMDDDRIGE